MATARAVAARAAAGRKLAAKEAMLRGKILADD
jgi:hypothetical protein